jgi:hypothetical protein
VKKMAFIVGEEAAACVAEKRGVCAPWRMTPERQSRHCWSSACVTEKEDEVCDVHVEVGHAAMVASGWAAVAAAMATARGAATTPATKVRIRGKIVSHNLDSQDSWSRACGQPRE